MLRFRVDSALPALRRGLTALRDALLPDPCVLCSGDAGSDRALAESGAQPGADAGAESGARLRPIVASGFCAGCLEALPGARTQRCSVCARATEAAATDEERLSAPAPTDAAGPAQAANDRHDAPGCAIVCALCRREPPPFAATLAAADYAPPLDRVITAFKFGRQVGLARPLGSLVARRWAEAGRPTLDALAVVPLAPDRLAERGFNQALEIARAAARASSTPHRDAAAAPRLPVPWRDALQRVRETPRQSSLDLAQRKANLRAAFVCTASVAGLRVGLVDDVMTSGATLEAAADALRKAGAREVVALVVARTP